VYDVIIVIMSEEAGRSPSSSFKQAEIIKEGFVSMSPKGRSVDVQTLKVRVFGLTRGGVFFGRRSGSGGGMESILSQIQTPLLVERVIIIIPF
jgi:hypothetical protein